MLVTGMSLIDPVLFMKGGKHPSFSAAIRNRAMLRKYYLRGFSLTN